MSLRPTYRRMAKLVMLAALLLASMSCFALVVATEAPATITPTARADS